ncbi:MAG: hypothetical protein K5746_02300 [Clostridiales bacterium]|nr:hypothetical protein [Clostridiales bacterium]
MRKILRERMLLAFAAALCVAVLFMLFFTSRFDKRKVWPDVKLTYMDEKQTFSLLSGDAYGVKSSGPYYDLPVGEYRLKWQIESDGENAIHLTCSNGARIEPDTIMIPTGSWEGESSFSILDPVHNLSIGVDFREGEQIRIRNLRLYSPGYKDRAFLALILFSAAFALYAAWKCGLLEERRGAGLLVIAAAAVVASGPFLADGILGGSDTAFHTARLMNLADALAGGQIPVRVGGFSYNGWGAATSIFYPDLFLYPFALMIVFGASLPFAYEALIFSATFLSGILIAAAAERMFRDKDAGLCASVLYMLCGYRLFDVYGRMALGEILAMVFLPLFLESLLSLFWGDKVRWRCAALCAAALLNSHMLTAALCAFLSLLCLIASFPRLLREKERRKKVALTAWVTLLLSLTRIVPLLDFLLQLETTPVARFGLEKGALSLRSLLLPGGWVGVLLWGGALASLLMLTEAEERPVRGLVVFLLLLGTLCAFLSSKLFPWALFSKLTGERAEVLQFPFRMLMFTAASFSLCGGYGFSRCFAALGRGKLPAIFLLSVLCASPYLTECAEKGSMIGFGQGANPYQVNPEYLIAGTNVNQTRSRELQADDWIVPSGFEKSGTRVSVRVKAERDGEIAFPVFGFPGYEAKLNGEVIPWHLGGNNRLTVSLSAGTEGMLVVRYAGKLFWRICDCVSVLMLLILLFQLRNDSRNKTIMKTNLTHRNGSDNS